MSLKNPQESQDIPYIWQIFTKYSKEEVWNILPEFLQKNVWACRRPLKEDTTWIECGKCVACKEINKIREPNVKSNRT